GRARYQNPRSISESGLWCWGVSSNFGALDIGDEGSVLQPMEYRKDKCGLKFRSLDRTENCRRLARTMYLIRRDPRATLDHSDRARSYVVGKRFSLSGGQIEMHSNQYRACREFSRFIIHHVVPEADSFLFCLE